MANLKVSQNDLTNKKRDAAPAATPNACAAGSADPHLLVKAIAGRPGATVAVSASGTRSNQKLIFKNQANEVVKAADISSSGNVVLPSRGGLYSLELLDLCNLKVSYGMATVNETSTGFTSNASESMVFTQGQYRIWPDSNLAVGDFDKDGKDDVAFASGGNGINGNATNPGIYIYKYNNASGKMALDSILPEPNVAEGIKFADLNNDGWLDLVWSSVPDEKIKIAYGSSTGFAAPISVSLPAAITAGTKYSYDLAVADLDRDGKPDLVLAGGIYNGASWLKSAIYILKNNGAGGFNGSVIEFAGATPLYTVRLADANDDGRLDIFTWVSTSSVQLYRILQKADGSFSAASAGTDYLATSPVHGSFWSDAISVGYINSDVYPDVIAQHTDGPSGVFLSNSSDLTLAASSIPGFTDQHGAVGILADLNADGVMDYYMPLKNRALFANKAGIMVRNSSNFNSAISPNAGNTILGPTSVGGWSYNAITMGDWNGDGKIDIFMPLNNDKKIDILYGN